MNKWKTLLALALMVPAVILNWTWFWGLFLWLALLNAIISGEIHFVEAIYRKENPKLYWTILLVWFAFAIYSVYNQTYFLI
ncbi:hypothetical protein [Sediminicola luteus]|uniref:Phosphatidate cytidylyltransferase n=1 Tax=Sediminicola luteus TaxID=319238 RepID=A0A2A4G9Z1_9FLAO|nr:hypothetical protein [Sediminicola luteus]PCE64790.1 hypothetical protein B7P33_06365 [Sediminicola luteus]